jgi:exodeoxyribonuclease VII small subunit
VTEPPLPHESADDGRARLSYEDARDELIQIVQRLELGGLPLEEALRLWERGEELARVCQAWLDGARARLEAYRAPEQSAANDVSAPGSAEEHDHGR